MNKKSGFISMALVYTFLIVFLFLMLSILKTYQEKDKFLEAINSKINEDISGNKKDRSTLINKILVDNIPSPSDSIKFFNISNNASGNGNGLFYIEGASVTDENNTGVSNRIYYFRGSVDNNNIVMSDICYKILRTNQDGSIRLVYNGTYTGGKCPSLADASSSSGASLVSIGSSQIDESNGIDYKNESLNGVYSKVNKWYSDNFITNPSDFTKYISKSAIYCNNKEVFGDGYKSKELIPHFIDETNTDIYDLTNITNTLTFKCKNSSDRLSVNNTGVNYPYPVGLLTAQDIVLAGGYLTNDSDEYEGGTAGYKNYSFYLYSNGSFWTMSPYNISEGYIYINEDGYMSHDTTNHSFYIRPVISVSEKMNIESGNGTYNNPYIAKGV